MARRDVSQCFVSTNGPLIRFESYGPLTTVTIHNGDSKGLAATHFF